MATFNDTKNREYTLNVTVMTVKVLRDEGFNIVSPNEILGLVENAPDFFRALWVASDAKDICKSDSEFYESFAGESLQSAIDAWIEAFADFFPNRHLADAMRTIAKKAKELAPMEAERMVKVATDAMEKMLAEPTSGE